MDGQNLADEREFVEQKQRSDEVLAWYRQYVELLRRLRSGRTPTALVGYCGQGGVTEGVRRAGGASHGQDIRAQPKYVSRFGGEAFTQGDSRSPLEMRRLKRAAGAFVTLASPPCKAHSTARMRGEPSEEPMIRETRAACEEVGGLYALENVVGATAEMQGAVSIRGSYFGLHVDRCRLWDANFELHVDRALKQGGDRLRRGTCTGHRRRWRRIDPFGRPETRDCCRGNLWVVQGDKPLRCTLHECADAMGLDLDHMGYDGMAQAVPPVYGQWVFVMACMREVEREFGLPAITYDEYESRPAESRRRMAQMLRGAGGADPSQGVEFQEARAGHVGAEAVGRRVVPSGGCRGGCCRTARAPPWEVGTPQYSPQHTDVTGDAVRPADEASVREAELREVYYSWAGDYDAVRGPEAAAAALSPIRPLERLGARWQVRDLAGRNSLLLLRDAELRGCRRALEALVVARPGTRVTVEVRGSLHVERLLQASGWREVRRIRRGRPRYASESGSASLEVESSFWALGDEAMQGGAAVDYAAAEAGMDPLDRVGAPSEPTTAKMARSYMEIPWERERWDVGLPAEIDEIMARRGVGIYPVEELGASEVPFYRWANDEGLLRSIQEADRAIAAGAMEYVPASRVAEVEAVSTIHPWTIVDQGGGKWRLCHDYSVGTNRVVPTAPFALPSVWDVVPTIRSGSSFAKYDIRDGFWHMPIGEDSKRRLVVRHPGTGRLIWASRLPFGYLEAPRLFCALTEAVISRLRAKVAGRDIHYYVFVDDVLVVGGSDELTATGCRLLEEEFAARGVQWAPHKKRGPCQCIEFLGLLLCNVPGLRGVTLTQKRLQKLLAELDEWAALEPCGGAVEVEPKPLASLLGKLVFASQVVRGGRTYMQGMLAAFKGLVVDWRRGAVAPVGGVWGKLELRAAFWRDLRWWRRHLELRSLAPFEGRPRGEGVLSGTDASGWGTGQVVWTDGLREEHSLVFTQAEKRRPINWRELLGVWRLCVVAGERLRGRTLLVETDNMATKDATRKMASKAEDMQELIRRIYRLSEKHGFTLRIMHTPGEKLDRPDQTSRGDAVEEPRMRLRQGQWDEINTRWGNFTGLVGSEREHHQCGTGAVGVDTRLWAHPTVSTVGTALRRIGERLTESRGHGIRALALVPDDDAAQWSSLLKYGLVVGRWAEGESVLEANVLGRWRLCDTRRATRLVVFPRAAGAASRRLRLSVREGMDEVERSDGAGGVHTVPRSEGYAEMPEAGGWRYPVMPGSFVYSLGADPAGRGALYRLVQPSERDAAGDAGVVVAQEVVLDRSRGALKSKTPIFTVGVNDERWRPDPWQLWTVDHWVSPLPGKQGARVQKYLFDYKAANKEIVDRGGAISRAESSGWVMLTPARRGGTSDWESVDSGYSPFRAHPPPTTAVPGSEPEADVVMAGSEGEELEAVSRDLARVHLEQSARKAGPAGQVQEPAWAARGGGQEGLAGEVVQPCQYAGLVCAGCHEEFGLGAPMLSHRNALVHPTGRCRQLHEASLELERDAERGDGRTVHYGVFCLGSEPSGVHTSWEEVEGMIARARSWGEELEWEECETAEAAARFVTERTMSSAVSGERRAPTQFEKGSTTRQTHLAEKLSEVRLARIRACVEGRCGHSHDDGSSTKCRGGCGRRLHVATCADMGRGFAALGNFTCVECRLRGQILERGVEVFAGDLLRRASPELLSVTERTMVLELGQGKEATAAHYAEFTRVEEEYVTGMGRMMEGELKLPRHSVAAFCSFCTWLSIDAERAKSLEHLVRAAGAFLTKLSLPDVTKDGRVKAHVKDLLTEVGIEHEPATAATPRMLGLIVNALIKERFSDPFIIEREAVQVLMEGVGGCRIGEVAGGGDCHGLLANEVCVLTNPAASSDDPAKWVVEARLEHSKTGFSRYLDMIGKTKTTQVEVARRVLAYWNLAGFKVTTAMHNGVMEQRPDFWVLRVSMLGLSEPELGRMLAWAAKSGIKSLEKGMATLQIAAKARQRWVASGTSSQQKKYINLMGGASDNDDMKLALAALKARGFEASIVPGPMLLATTGGKYPKVTHMPLAVSSAFGPTKELLVAAHQRANEDPMDPDPDLELKPGEAPKWSTHSLRRLADTVARRYREISNTSRDEIDLYFGWQERMLKKAMQVHYASMSVLERMATAKITGWL